MQSRKIRINRNNIVKQAAFFGFGSYLCTLLKIKMVASILFACSLLSVAANYLFFISKRKRIKLEDIVLALSVSISVILSKWQLNFDYFKQVIIVCCTVLCIDFCAEESVDESTRKMVATVIVLTTMITVWQYYFFGLRYSFFNSTASVALNFSNPNETAMWLVFLIILLCDATLLQKNFVVKTLLIVLLVAMLPILIGTESRNGWFAIAFFFMGKIFMAFSKIKKLPGWVLMVITLAPLLVYLGYMYIFLPNYDRLYDWFSFLVSEGKPLTSRSEIWSDLEIRNWKHILFGNYDVYHREQMHNSALTLLCQFGVFNMFVINWKFYRVLRKISDADAQLALGSVWLTGCFEASIFVGIAGMYMLILLLPVFHTIERYDSEHNY